MKISDDHGLIIIPVLLCVPGIYAEVRIPRVVIYDRIMHILYISDFVHRLTIQIDFACMRDKCSYEPVTAHKRRIWIVIAKYIIRYPRFPDIATFIFPILYTFSSGYDCGILNRRTINDLSAFSAGILRIDVLSICTRIYNDLITRHGHIRRILYVLKWIICTSISCTFDFLIDVYFHMRSCMTFSIVKPPSLLYLI